MKNILKTSLILLLLIGISPTTTWAQGSRFTQEEINLQKMLIEASREKLLRNYESAASLYEQIIKENRSYPSPHFELARVYVELGKMDLALKEVQTAIRLDDSNEWYKTFLADLYDKEGYNRKAAAIYEQLVKTNPDNDSFYFQWAYFLVKAEEGEAAIAVFNQLETKAGITEEMSSRKHKIWQQLGKKKEAAGEYERLLDKYPTNLDYRHTLARYYVQIGNQKNAKKQYEKIIALSPEDARANLAIASFEGKAKKGDDVAYLETLQTLFKQTDVLIDVKIAKLYPYVVNITKQENVLQEQILGLGMLLAEVHPTNAKAHAIHGDLLYQLNRESDALEAYKRTLELDDTVFPVWENTMQIYYTTKEYDNLAKFSEEAMDLFPNQGNAYYYNGLANLEKGAHRDAIASLELVLMMASNNPVLLKNAYLALGETYKRLEKFDLSEDAFNRAKAIKPKG